MAGIVILLYHDIESSDCPNEKTDKAAKDTVVDVDQFDDQLRFLAENGYQSLSLKDYFELRSAITPIPPKRVIITFDDGHYSNYHLAFPILKKYGFNAVFFVVAGRIGELYHVTADQLVEMADHGMEIASHGMTHAYLPLLNSEEIEKEVIGSKQLIEDIIKQRVDYFAYPGGHYSIQVLDIVAGAGFTGACSCLQGLSNLRTKPFLLKRMEVRGRSDIADFENIFDHTHVFFYQCVDFWKRLFRRLIGLKAYARLRSRFYRYYGFKR